MLSGLLALVPDNSAMPSVLTAYLVDSAQHERSLSVFGDVKLDSSGGGTMCQPPVSRVIKCSLNGADIELLGLTRKAHPPGDLPDPPHEVPANAGEEPLLGWFVRMSRVYKEISGVGKAKDWPNLKAYVAVRLLNFPWDRARSLELDGGELGHAARVGFKARSESVYSSVQAAAESLVFNIDTDADSLQIKVWNADHSKSQVITAKLDAAMMLLNNYVRSTPCKPDEDGEHFLDFYNLLANPPAIDKQRLAFRVDAGDRMCIQDSLVSANFAGGIFDILRPINPKAFGEAAKKISSVKTLADLKALIVEAIGENAATKAPKQRGKALKVARDNELVNQIMIVLARVADRIVCPPVLLESP
jgi:hypothetical protein